MTDNEKLEIRRERKAKEREGKARTIAIKILDLRELISAEANRQSWNEQTTRELNKLIGQLLHNENLLKGWSYSVHETVLAAAKYREDILKEDKKPQPVIRDGASAYHMAYKSKHWS